MTPRVIVHGGVDSPAGPEVWRSLREAAAAGMEALASGAGAVSAVRAAVRVLEENPLFNAGLGSVLNEDGTVETDASIVDGAVGRFSGVAALSGILHPIDVAAELLHRPREAVLLVGTGAERFAAGVGIARRDLRTPEQVRAWELARAGGGSAHSPFTGRELSVADTVGAIALDERDRLAAGSSTGGLLLKKPGRVGDAAIFGAGIYADRLRAALCSGVGEAAIELSLALRTVLRYEQERDIEAAVSWGVELLASRRAVGGILVFEAATDSVAVAHNAAAFPVVVDDGAGASLVAPVQGAGEIHA